MIRSWTLCAAALALLLGSEWTQAADDAALPPEEIAKKALAAVGGEQKLLRLFRMKEAYTLGEGKTKTPRTSVLEPPNHWWIGANERAVPEPGTLLAWCWTLGILADKEAKLAPLPPVEHEGKKLIGLSVSTTAVPQADLYFSPETWLLARLDWKKDQYFFSDWKDVDGTKYAALCTATRNGKQFVATEILEIERLADLPAGLKRREP